MTRLDDGILRIDHADPRILISAELPDLLADCPAPQSDAWLDVTECRPGYGYVGAVLHIEGVNRTVIYRIGEYMPHAPAYIGEWPD